MNDNYDEIDVEFDSEIDDDFEVDFYEEAGEEFSKCNACFGTGMDRELDTDCLVCWGEGYI